LAWEKNTEPKWFFGLFLLNFYVATFGLEKN